MAHATLQKLEHTATFVDLPGGDQRFVPSPEQRAILRAVRDRLGKAAACESYYELRRAERPRELEQMDPRRLKDLMLRARYGTGMMRHVAVLHLRGLTRREQADTARYRAGLILRRRLAGRQ